MKYFAPFHFDDAERTLWREQHLLPLTRKAGDLLACLIRSQGKWVTKEAILATVWPDTHVHPDNIKVLVHEIRQALDDNARRPQFIKSESGRGYAFIAAMTDCTPPPSDVREGLPHVIIRVPELAALGEALDAARAGQSRSVLVVGEHGIGKTALCDIFSRAASAAVPLRVVFGRCRENAPHALQPFLDALRQLAARHPAIVWRALAAHAPTWLAQIPELRGRAPVPTSGQPGVPLYRQLSAVLSALTRDVPLTLIVEDLQWAEEATVAAFTALAQEERQGGWMLIGTACAHDATRVSSRVARLAAFMRTSPSCSVVDLGPLTFAQVARFVDARFGRGCLSDVAEVLYDVTGGNPRLVATAVDGLVSRGLVRYTADRWRCDSPFEVLAGTIPEILRETFVRDIEGLSAAEQSVLEAACAVGLEFTLASVAVAADLDVRSVQLVLDPLAQRGRIIRPAGERLQPGCPGPYRFRHALYAELIAERTPIGQHLRSAGRLARAEERQACRA